MLNLFFFLEYSFLFNTVILKLQTVSMWKCLSLLLGHLLLPTQVDIADTYVKSEGLEDHVYIECYLLVSVKQSFHKC